MATETAGTPVNGNYGAEHSYTATEHQIPTHTPHNTNSASNGARGDTASISGGNASPGTAESSSGSVSKDEVGWYFVEQYYTTMSRNPEKLHLFYSKQSQFVSGVEAEKVSVSVGQRAIIERIKELDIQDCKVRVSNVDSQESFKNIVVQVIGEMSNKAAPHRKFVQTFVLAEQPNGYFVLNDIFRYISEEEEEDEMENPAPPELEASASTMTEPEPKNLSSSEDQAVQEQDAEVVDKKLEEAANLVKSEEATADKVVTNGNPTPEAEREEEAIAPAISLEADKGEVQAEHLQPNVEEPQPEKPKDPDPTPSASPPKLSKAVPAQAPTPPAPSKPAPPKTWANMVAANAVAANRAASQVVTSNGSSNTSAPSQPKAPPPSLSTVAAPTTPSHEDPAPSQQSPGAGWQTAGQDNGKRQTKQQSVSGGNAEKSTIHGYVKNVTEKVDASILKTTLNQFGKVEYFDVNRQKNCAFVEFADIAGYNAAVAANPHVIGGEQIYVEERRPRSAPYAGGYSGRGGARGGRGGVEGRTPSQGRGGFQQKDGGRGTYTPRGRGGNGNVTPRGGRGNSQAA